MRLIDADARVTVQSFDEEHEEYVHTEMSVEEALDFATDEGCPPVVEAEPVRHGRWIPMYELTREGILPDEPMGYMCDQCKAKRKKRLNYCPNCGARMDGGGSK